MKLFLTSLITALLMLSSSSIFAKTLHSQLVVTGIGSTCEEASKDVLKEIAYINTDAIITGISLTDCQSPDFAHVEKSAIVKLTTPEN